MLQDIDPKQTRKSTSEWCKTNKKEEKIPLQAKGFSGLNKCWTLNPQPFIFTQIISNLFDDLKDLSVA